MKALKIIGIVLLVIFIVLTTLFTIYFLFANEGYGIDMLTQIFEDGFLGRPALSAGIRPGPGHPHPGLPP